MDVISCRVDSFPAPDDRKPDYRSFAAAIMAATFSGFALKGISQTEDSRNPCEHSKSEDSECAKTFLDSEFESQTRNRQLFRAAN